jgi:hypothetical protein
MAELVQENAEEQRHDYGGGDERRERITRIPVTDVGEEGKQQEEGPMDLDVYTERLSYLEGTAHTSRVYPTAVALM